MFFMSILVIRLVMGGPRLCLGGRSPTLYQGLMKHLLLQIELMPQVSKKGPTGLL
jgi:hypothetical protein